MILSVHQAAPGSLLSPLCSSHFLQYLASSALAPLRYVFLRYGGFISDEVEVSESTQRVLRPLTYGSLVAGLLVKRSHK